MTPLELLEEYETLGAELLGISPAHVMVAESLPLHHRDPFDRMLIAQAMTESLTLLTVDEQFAQYDVQTVW